MTNIEPTIAEQAAFELLGEHIDAAKANAEAAAADVVDAVADVRPAAASFAAEVREAPTVFQNQKSVASILRANPLYPKLMQLALWRDPVKSGLFFGIATSTYILLNWMNYTVITLLSYLFFAVLAICFGYTQYVYLRGTWLRGTPNPENPFVAAFRGVNFHVSKDAAQPHLDTILELVNVAIDRLVSVYFITNRILAVQYLAIFYVAAWAGQWFSGLSYAYIAVVVFFVWPRLYEEKKKEIDQVAQTVRFEAQKYMDLAVSKLPPQVKQFAGLSDSKKKRL